MRYRAFFSYARADDRIANWLHRQLDGYRTPKALVGSEGELGTVPPKLHPIFRDRTDLESGGHVDTALQQALEDSETLIVLCTPTSAKSHWVNHEVETFLKLGREVAIFPVIAAGVPDSGDPETECFPPALRRKGLLAADLREIKLPTGQLIGDGREGGRLKLIAGLLGVNLDALVQRERQAERRRRLRANVIAGSMSALALVALGAGAFAWIKQGEALVSLDRARKSALAERAARTEADAQRRFAEEKAISERVARQAEARQRAAAVASASEARRQELNARIEKTRADEAAQLATKRQAEAESILQGVVTNLPVRWPTRDADSPDYRHLSADPLGVSLRSLDFALTASDVTALLVLNSFEVESDPFVLVLRGAQATSSLGVGVPTVQLRDVRPDHRQMTSVALVIDRRAGLLTPFRASSEPSDPEMRMQFLKQLEPGNRQAHLLATGLYLGHVGGLRLSSPRPSLVRLEALVPARRTISNLMFDLSDPWALDVSGSVIIPGSGRSRKISSVLRSRSGEVAAQFDPALDGDVEFLSNGLINIRGSWNADAKVYSGDIAGFRMALGLGGYGNTQKLDPDPRDDGRPIGTVVLTALDAAVAVAANAKGEGVQEGLRRLRFGSTGSHVRVLQRQLQVRETGRFDLNTLDSFVTRQNLKLGWSDGILAPDIETRMSLCVFADASCR